MNPSQQAASHVRALAKGLNVLAAVNELSPARVSSLVLATSLPKATLLRLLKTLVAEGYVIALSKSEGGGYAPAPKVRLLASAYGRAGALGQTAQPLLNNLAELIKWPADLLVRDGVSMFIEASNRRTSPIQLNKFEQKRFSLLESSAGQAYLAWQSSSVQHKLIKAASAQLDADTAALQLTQLQQGLKMVKEKAYTVHEYDTPIQGPRVFSVPVLHAKISVAVLTVVTLREIVSIDDFEEKILPRVIDAAQQLASACVPEEIASNA